MTLQNIKILYVFLVLGLGLIILFPTLTQQYSGGISTIIDLRPPDEESYSELWLLGSGHSAENYPFDVIANATYSVYVGAANHMGGLEYYRTYIKLRNQSDPLPDNNGTSSPFIPLLQFDFILADREVWESEVVFSFANVAFEGNVSRVSAFTVAGRTMNVDKSAIWDEQGQGFYYQLFFELWIYDTASSSFKYHNRHVSLWLNATVPT